MPNSAILNGKVKLIKYELYLTDCHISVKRGFLTAAQITPASRGRARARWRRSRGTTSDPTPSSQPPIPGRNFNTAFILSSVKSNPRLSSEIREYCKNCRNCGISNHKWCRNELHRTRSPLRRAAGGQASLDAVRALGRRERPRTESAVPGLPRHRLLGRDHEGDSSNLLSVASNCNSFNPAFHFV